GVVLGGFLRLGVEIGERALLEDGVQRARDVAADGRLLGDDQGLHAVSQGSAGCQRCRERDTQRALISPMYLLAAIVTGPPVKLLFRLRATGKQHLPREGGYVLSANHLSNIDPWPLGLPLFPRRQIRVIA